MANNTTNEVRATAKYVRVAPRKARAVVGLIRNLPVAKALEVLQFNTRAVSEDISKVLRSAVANAVHNNGMRADIRPRAKGSASRINKRMSHITIVVAPRKEA